MTFSNAKSTFSPTAEAPRVALVHGCGPKGRN